MAEDDLLSRADDPARRAEALAADAEALFRDGRLDAAEARFGEAAALVPTPGRLHNLATIRQLKGDHAAAEAGFRRALELDPSHARARASLGLSILAQGRLAEGFALYDAWRSIPEIQGRAAPDIGVPQWSGEDVAGKRVVIWGEEGFGDQLMFARFAPLLREAGAAVGWVVHSALVRLVREGLGMEAIEMRPGIKLAGPDYVAPTSRLASVLMPRLGAPPPAPYLKPPPANRIEGLTLGVVARGNPEHDNDHHRSLSPQAAEALMALPGAVDLAPQATGARDFHDTAGIVAGLELVITVDTSVAHLAGALGKPVWVLLPAIGTDWRWGASGETTPWYPTMRLFRQKTPGDWSAVIDRVRAALAAR
ncbi:MAG: hypothetical protein JWP50_1883 [Phenylobacterium sp.]|nr:hypothetical protein [Phenylobacterium sp.]